MTELWQQVTLLALGIVQGLTEVLPISSSGHLVLVNKLFSVDSVNLPVAVALHGGSFLAILLWFRRDLYALWQNFSLPWREKRWRRWPKEANGKARLHEARLPYYLAISLIPVAIEGLVLKDTVEAVFSRSEWVPAFLAVNGLIILATARWTRGERRLDELKLWEYVLIGIIQGFGVLPGISRLGMALCAGLGRHLNWYEAMRLTFILALPVIAGAFLLEVKQLAPLFGSLSAIIGLIVGTLCAFFFSLLGLKVFTAQNLLERRTLTFFGFYCFLLGVFTFTYIQVGL